MTDDDDWTRIRGMREAETGLSGVFKLSVFFGIAVVALAVFVTPLARRASEADTARSLFGIDTMSTGSVGSGQGYTIRRSVLQQDPSAVCIIMDSGARQGDC